MASDFPVRVANGFEHTVVEEYTPSQVSGETFIPNDFVVWDDSNNWVERAGADPTPIYGLSEVNSENARVLTPNGKVPIRRLLPGVRLEMCSATTYAEATHRNQEYGIVRLSSGNWAVDVAETTNVRVKVVDGRSSSGIPSENVFVVIPLAEHFDDGIDS